MIKTITPFIAIILLFSVACNQSDAPKEKVKKIEQKLCLLETVSHTDTNSYSVLKYKYPLYQGGSCVFCSVINDSIKGFVNSQISNFYKDSTDYISFVSESSGQFVELHITANIELENENFLSVKIQNYSYLLGAHGNSEHKFFNFNKADCSQLNLSDIIDFSKPKSDSTLNALLVANFKNSDNCFDSIPSATSDFKKFALTQKGILFWYDAYELGAYACGAAEVVVPYKELQNSALLKPSFSSL